MSGVHPFQLTDFHPSEDVRKRHAEDLGSVADGVALLRLEEEAADVRGGVGHGMILLRTVPNHCSLQQLALGLRYHFPR
jgi:hypothetical protein